MNMISQVEDKLLQAASGDKQHAIQENVERCSMIQLRCFVLVTWLERVVCTLLTALDNISNHKGADPNQGKCNEDRNSHWVKGSIQSIYILFYVK